MSQEQKKIVGYWLSLITIILIGACISLSDSEYKKLALFSLVIVITGVSLVQDFSFYTRANSRQLRLGEFVENHPVLKVYLVLYCALVMPFMVYFLSNMPFGDQKLLLYVFNLMMLLGPMGIILERNRFKCYAIDISLPELQHRLRRLTDI